MVRKTELEKKGYFYICVESKHDEYENTKALNAMGVPQERILYVEPWTLEDVDFPADVIENMKQINACAVFYKPE